MKRFFFSACCLLAVMAGCTEIDDDDAPLPQYERQPAETTTDSDVTPGEIDATPGTSPEGTPNYRGDIVPETPPNQNQTADPSVTDPQDSNTNPRAAPGTVNNVPDAPAPPATGGGVDNPAVEEQPAVDPPAELQDES